MIIYTNLNKIKKCFGCWYKDKKEKRNAKEKILYGCVYHHP
jgi:hypothetical protein